MNVIALTATATCDTLDVVAKRLSMPHPVVIGLPPHRSNIFYSVQPYIDIFKLSNYIIEYIESHSSPIPKVVVFCPMLDLGSKLNKLLRCRLRGKYGDSQ